MPDPFRIWGSAASHSPFKQTWVEKEIGQELNLETRYFSHREVLLEFDSCSLPLYKQWEDAVNGGSVGTVSILAPDSTTITAYSNVFLKFDKRPVQEAGMVSGTWSIRILDVLVS